MKGGRTIRLGLMALLLSPSTAARATPPYYDPAAYCRHVIQFGGLDQSFGGCYRQEQAAYNRIKLYWNDLAVGSRVFCDGVAESAGSSYQILETCLQGIIAKDPGNRPSAR